MAEQRTVYEIIATNLGATEPVNGSWLIAIANTYGITSPTNGSWHQAIAEHLGETEATNGSWMQSILTGLGLTVTSPDNSTLLMTWAAGGGAPSYDPDAQAFIDAAGLTDTTQKNAINTLVVDLKADSLWTKFYALYPFVGGTASTHKWNLVNPLDTDAAYRLTEIANGGSIAHSSTGVTFDTLARYNSFINPSVIAADNWHMTHYNQLEVTTNGYDMGSFQTSGTKEWASSIGSSGTLHYTSFDNFATLNTTYFVETVSTTKGFYIDTRGSGGAATQYIGTSVKNTGTLTLTNLNSYIGVGGQLGDGATPRGNGSANVFSFASIGNNFTATDVTNLDTIVTAYQTALGRAL